MNFVFLHPIFEFIFYLFIMLLLAAEFFYITAAARNRYWRMRNEKTSAQANQAVIEYAEVAKAKFEAEIAEQEARRDESE